MARYSSKPVAVERPATEIAGKFADFSVLEGALEAMPEAERAKVGEISFDRDVITITTPQVGAIRLRAVERTPEAVVLEAEGAPVAMKLEIAFKPLAATRTEVTGSVDVDIPVMLKPLVGPAMQKAADQFGEIFAGLF